MPGSGRSQRCRDHRSRSRTTPPTNRAKIIGIEPGAGWMRKTVQAVEQYRLDLQLAEGSTAGMTAVDRQLPIVVTLWTPTWTVARYAMKLPHDPKGVFAASDRQPDRAKMFLREKPEPGKSVPGSSAPAAFRGRGGRPRLPLPSHLRCDEARSLGDRRAGH
ncbi:glycine betaine ABC transporter substrate-binding protein [Paracoccus sp. FO-3]|uniref:glycine betaine ABC transporter substrate-binding protein n=1 Tax=Paracoccus sp. FO-3 TaxID=1335059 RepID=UPI0021057D2A|nr:glycine betaine ABC transporter substrate-binding protein [Paracoccus sp. FO-3]